MLRRVCEICSCTLYEFSSFCVSVKCQWAVFLRYLLVTFSGWCRYVRFEASTFEFQGRCAHFADPFFVAVFVRHTFIRVSWFFLHFIYFCPKQISSSSLLVRLTLEKDSQSRMACGFLIIYSIYLYLLFSYKSSNSQQTHCHCQSKAVRTEAVNIIGVDLGDGGSGPRTLKILIGALTSMSDQSFCLLCGFVHMILWQNAIIAFSQSSLRHTL